MSVELSVYTAIDEVPLDLWDTMTPRASITLDHRHMRAVEASGINDIEPYYVVVRSGGEVVGIAHFFVFVMDFSAMSDDLTREARLAVKTWYPNFMTFKIIECGFISSTGKAISVHDEYSEDFYLALADQMEMIGREKSADIILIRDVPFGEVDGYSPFQKAGYLPVMGYPSTVLELPWDSFEEYLDALRNAQRKNVKKTLKCLEQPGLSVEVIDDFAGDAVLYAALWKQVNSRAGSYQHEVLNSAYFERMSKDLGVASYVVTMRREGEPVAFGLCLQGEEEIGLVHIGIDYDWNQEYKLYFNMFVECIKEAIKRGAKRVDAGITTYFYKCKLGCELNPLVYFVKHIGSRNKTLAFRGLLRDSIKQPENEHQSFRDEPARRRIQLSEFDYKIESSIQPKNRDIFQGAYSYIRMEKLRFADLYSFFPLLETAQLPVISHKGRDVVLLGNNSYLGLTTDERVKSEAKRAIDAFGTGCSGSPILNGTTTLHGELVERIASFMRKDDAIVVGTGYQTNVAVITAIAGRADAVVVDELNHASLIDGARYARATILPYKHNDMDSLRAALDRFEEKKKLLVVDSLFSMEGTIVDLPSIVQIAREYGARILLDEAHSIGVVGEGGRGVAEKFGLMDEIDLIMGTFSKSFGAVGGFVAGEKTVIEFLRHSCRPHIFSASLPPSVIATVLASLKIIMEEPQRREVVLSNARFMAGELKALGYETQFNETAIVPIYCRNEVLTLALYKKLLERGVFVNPVLSPAVPKGAELLRTSYMATHDRKTLLRAVEIFRAVRNEWFPNAGGRKVSSGENERPGNEEINKAVSCWKNA
jgi:8-amino-7-oxononanoate synthase